MDEHFEPLDTSTDHVRDLTSKFLALSIKKLIGPDFVIAKECWRTLIEIAVERDHYANLVSDLQNEIRAMELEGLGRK